MKLYLFLRWEEYDGEWPIALFSTLALAEAFMEKVRPKQTAQGGWRIQEMVVDEEPPLTRHGRIKE